jgi:hypothetical protein
MPSAPSPLSVQHGDWSSIPNFYERCIFRIDNDLGDTRGNVTFSSCVKLIHEVTGKVLLVKPLSESRLSSTCQACVLQHPTTFSKRDDALKLWKLLPAAAIHSEGGKLAYDHHTPRVLLPLPLLTCLLCVKRICWIQRLLKFRLSPQTQGGCTFRGGELH